MSILGKLIAEIQQGDKPADQAASAEVQSSLFTETKRTWKQKPPQAVGSAAHSDAAEGDLIYLPRSPAFPEAVHRLDWGGPVPHYVFFNDGLYAVEGWRERTSYRLIEWTRPPWIGIGATCDPPDPSEACVQCGRRLFYSCAVGDFCACCYFPSLKMMIAKHIAEPTDTIAIAHSRLNFFLLPGVGLDW